MYAQKNTVTIDSLKQVLSENLPDSTIAKALSKLASNYYPLNLDSAKYYSLRAIDFSKNIQDYQRAYDATTILFKVTSKMDGNKAALKHALNSLELARKTNNKATEANAWRNMANYYLTKKDYDSAAYAMTIQYELNISRGATADFIARLASSLILVYLRSADYDKARKLILDTNDLLKTGEVSFKAEALYYHATRNYYYIIKEYSVALEYANKALEVWTEIGDKSKEIESHLYLGELYRLTNSVEKAKNSLGVALELSEKHGIDGLLLRIHQRLAYLYKTEKLYEDALKHMFKVLSIAQNNQDSARLITSHYTIGEILLLSGESQKGKDAMLKCKAVFDAGKGTLNLSKHQEVTIYRGLSRLDSALGNWKGSLANYRIYTKLEQQLNDFETRQRIKELEVEHETKEKNKRIELLSAENNIQKLTTNQQQWTIWLVSGVGALLLMLLTVLYNRFRLKKRSVNTIQIKIQENEMLMQEVHHRVKNNLQIMLSLLQTQSRLIKDSKAKMMVAQSGNRIKSMALIHENLYLSGNLVMVQADTYFKDLTANIMSSFNRNDKVIDIETNIIDMNISMNLAVPIGLILNELITNSVKYAFTGREQGRITINFKQDEENKYYILQVKDNGTGLPKDLEIDTASSFGLQLVAGLTKQLNGYFEVDGENGTGFDIYVQEQEID